LKIITSVKDQREYCQSLISDKKNISFIPTMGNFHLGHQSLFESSAKDEISIASIFINPLQFDDNNDYISYPKSLNEDIDILKLHKIDCLFLPNEKDIISDLMSIENILLPDIFNKLCGRYRANHFEGVFVIVKKLFEIIQPSKVYFGRKDYQQLLLVKYLVNEYFNSQIKIIGCEIVRDENGLALSSRNNKLTNKQKKVASLVYKELHKLKLLLINDKTIFSQYKNQLIKKFTDNNIIVEYLEVLSNDNLDDFIKKDKIYNIFIAFYVNNIRLIDNIEI